MAKSESKRRAVLIAFWDGALKEERREARKHDRVHQNFSLREFLSYSNGKGRKRRKSPKEVSLVIINATGRAVLLKDVPTKRLDVLVEEAIGGELFDKTTAFEEFIKRLKAR